MKKSLIVFVTVLSFILSPITLANDQCDMDFATAQALHQINTYKGKVKDAESAHKSIMGGIVWVTIAAAYSIPLLSVAGTLVLGDGILSNKFNSDHEKRVSELSIKICNESK